MASERDAPYISADRTLPEITPKALILGVVLSAVLAAANAYLGLFAGTTVSASIPASVMSMALLRFFKGNILENNGVQTAAASGEAIAGGVIFTLPALLILGTWVEFDYWETTMLAAFGGVLGVLFTAPLRRALIVEGSLAFPEGVATAEVLKSGEAGGTGMKYIALSSIIGALFKLGESGLTLWTGTIEGARRVGSTILYFGSSLSPALVAVGYIVGLNVSILVIVGGALNWLVAIPIYAAMYGIPSDPTVLDAANTIWSEQTRYIGVGGMIVGGLWALVSLRKSLALGVRSGLDAYREMKSGVVAVRTERDIPLVWIGGALIASIVPLFWIFFHITGVLWVSALMSMMMMIAGFLFSAVAAYMAGLVGSSNNPISGVTLATILTSSLLLVALLGRESKIGPAAAILIGSAVCCAAAVAGDNMQDLKAGRLLGSTPSKQQLFQIIGVLGAAWFLAPVLNLLQQAYGMGMVTPEHPNPLPAPQATLMASVASGVFTGKLPWTMVSIGAAIAVVVIALDEWLERRKSEFRTPVLAVAVGIYLPLSLSVPMFIGGIIAHVAARALKDEPREVREGSAHNGLLVGAGLITGEALAGIAIAVPIVVSGRKDVLAMFGTFDTGWPGVVLLLLVVILLYRVAAKRSVVRLSKE